MARVEIKGLAIGTIVDRRYNVGVAYAFTCSGTVYVASTGGTTLSGGQLVSNIDGELPGWLEPGIYTIAVPSISKTVTFEIGGFAGTDAFLLKSNSMINARDVTYGALGDGINDDTTELQAAITASAGRALYIPFGTYIITSALTIPSNTLICGDGGATIIKHTSTGVAKCFVNSDQAAFGNNVGIAIMNLTVDRTASASNDPYNNPIHMRYVDGLLVQGCRIRGGGSGCHVEACSNARIVNNQVDSFTDKGISSSWATGFGGTELTDPEVLIANNTVRQTAATKHAAGSSPLLTTQDRTVFANNIVISTVALSGFGIEFGDAEGAMAIGNTFVGCGVLVGSGSDISVVGNHFSDGAVAGSANTYVQVTGAAPNPTRILIADNNYKISSGPAIKVATTASFITIRGNTARGGQGAIQVLGDDCEIIDNVVEGATLRGIWVTTGARIYIAGNVARDCGQDAAGSATTKVGFIFDSLTDPTIVNNLAISSKAATADMLNGYYINACTNIRWRDNDSRGHTTAMVTTSGTPTYDNSKEVLTVASATATTLPARTNTFVISGTTTITSIVATGWAGQIVSLRFSGILTLTDGSNLKLSANLVTTADDSIVLFCDGTNWYELGRAVN